jgi:hypothetical protein
MSKSPSGEDIELVREHMRIRDSREPGQADQLQQTLEQLSKRYILESEDEGKDHGPDG